MVIGIQDRDIDDAVRCACGFVPGCIHKDQLILECIADHKRGRVRRAGDLCHDLEFQNLAVGADLFMHHVVDVLFDFRRCHVRGRLGKGDVMKGHSGTARNVRMRTAFTLCHREVTLLQHARRDLVSVGVRLREHHLPVVVQLFAAGRIDVEELLTVFSLAEHGAGRPGDDFRHAEGHLVIHFIFGKLAVHEGSVVGVHRRLVIGEQVFADGEDAAVRLVAEADLYPDILRRHAGEALLQ